MSEPAREAVVAALAGDAKTIRALVADLTPVIQARAARVLLRRRALAKGTDVRQAVDDMVQDVFVTLFRDDGKALRAWDPARGMGLRGFVGMIAEQHVAAILRTQGKHPWPHDLTVDVDKSEEGEAASSDDPEQRAASRQEIEKVVALVNAELTPLGRELFHRLIVQEEAIASVCATTGMSTAAVQAWSSRLKKIVARCVADVAADPPRDRVGVEA